MSKTQPQPYAGFWRRVVAFTLDLIVALLAVGLGWIGYLWAKVISGLLHGLEVQRDIHQFIKIALEHKQVLHDMVAHCLVVKS